MALVRDIGFTLPALKETLLVTCSALGTTGSTGSLINMQNSTADAIVSTGGPLLLANGVTTSTSIGVAFGRIIDRKAAPFGAGYYAASVNAYAVSTRGSTEADRAFMIGAKLQHGNSSGGGDMADFSTQMTPPVRNYFSSARTTDQSAWEVSGRSTGELDACCNPNIYDLSGANRFIRAVVFAGKDRVTTESSGDEQARVGASITFVSADVLAQAGTQGWSYSLERNSPESSSTSTQ